MNNINENLIANTNFRIWILNCRGGEIKRKIMPDATVLRRTSMESCYVTLKYCDVSINITPKKPINERLNSNKKPRL